MLKIFQFIFLCLFCSASFAHTGAHLGKIDFPTSTENPTAQAYFVSGVLLLHSFAYDEAREYFQKAEKEDPNFALAYWGEAMTYNHPLWNEQDVEAARKALAKLAPIENDRLKKTNIPKEKALLGAVDILYGKGSKKERDLAYAAAMEKLYQQYPTDDEIASLYALSLLGTKVEERDFKVYMQAAGIIEQVYANNPDHPGALHYAIHAYDDPIHAPLGLRTALLFAKAAPDASHALHMPSHIFLPLGMWNDVIASNKAAWEAGVKTNKSGEAKNYNVHDLHALFWLSYGYAQKQDTKAALQAVKELEKIAQQANTPLAKWYYAMARATYITETQDWDVDLPSLDMTGIETTAQATNLYINAMIQMHKDALTPCKKIMTLLEALCRSIPDHVPEDSYPEYFTSITSTGIAAGKIMLLELKASLNLREGKIKEAIAFAQQAADAEEKLPFGYGPPIPVKPAYELLGDILLQDKQYAQAEQAYKKAAERAPKRLLAEQWYKLAVTSNKK